MEVMSGMFQPGLGRGGWRGWRNDLGLAGMMLVVGAVSLAIRVATSRAAVVIDSNVVVEAGNASYQLPPESFWIGNSGAGSLTIQQGGRVDGRDVLAGYSTGRTGSIVVDGPGAMLVTHYDVVNDETGLLNIGQRGSGTLIIRNGGYVEDNRSYNAYYPGSFAVLRVEGTGSLWKNHGHMYVGTSGQGWLYVRDGGRVESLRARVGEFTGSRGEANIVGPGSSWIVEDEFSIGKDSDSAGVLNITNGGLVSDAIGVIGRSAGSTGIVNVEGAGSTWQNVTQLHVGGYLGQGTLNVKDGALVVSGWSTIGHSEDASGEVNIIGSGSLWQATGYYGISPALSVGYHSRGRLNILGGGRVESVNAAVGSDRGSFQGGAVTSGVGVVNVEGEGSIWHNDLDLIVGRSPGTDGTLNISSGGRVENSNGFLGLVADSAGRAVVSGAGSTWNSSNGLYVGGSAYVAGGTGELVVADGGIVSAGAGITIYAGGVVRLDGGEISGPTVYLRGGSIVGSGVVNAVVRMSALWTADVPADGTLTVAAIMEDVAGQGLVKTGAGTLTVDGVPAHTGGTHVMQGVFTVGGFDGGTVEVGSGGVVLLREGGGIVSRLSSVNFGGTPGAWEGRFDISDNVLVLHDGVLADVRAQVRQGRGPGDWSGQGFVSSAAAADVLGIHGVAAFINDSGDGLAAIAGEPSSAVVVRYVLIGDVNFDNVIDQTDYHAVDQGFLDRAESYVRGDFDLTGTVDADDYYLIDRSYLFQGGTPQSRPQSAAATFTCFATIPEPSTCILMAAFQYLLGRRLNRVRARRGDQ